MSTSGGSSPDSPTFTIPSDVAVKRQKMKRLTKKLGEGVPVHLVFPPTAESDDEEVLIDSPTSTPSVEQEDVVDRAAWDSREMLWENHTSRRSKFADARASLVTGRYVVHYRDADGLHGKGDETFGGFKYRTFSPIPEE